MACTLWAESLHDHRNILYGIFPERSFVMMWSSPLPDDDSGMWSCRIDDTFPYVECFRELLSCWEDAPACLSAPLDMRTFDATIYFEQAAFCPAPPSSIVLFTYLQVSFNDITLLQPQEPSPVPEGSVDDENREQSPTKDSGTLADDMTVVDSASEVPTIKHSDGHLLTNLCLDEMIRDGDLHVILDDDDEVAEINAILDDEEVLPVDCPCRKQSLHKGLDNALDELSLEDSDYNDAEGTKSGSDNDIAKPPAKLNHDEDSMLPAPPPTHVDKGKCRAPCAPPDDEEIDDDGHVIDDEQDLDIGKVPGRLPQEATRRALALSEKTEQEAKKIAKEYGKDVQMILIAA
ncbi:hypothetical protein AZE42_12096, partial [Rhizopogon vesiculosus]